MRGLGIAEDDELAAITVIGSPKWSRTGRHGLAIHNKDKKQKFSIVGRESVAPTAT